MKFSPTMRANNQKGFSMITAIFLLVVLSGLGAVMLTFFTAQQQSSALDVMGSRAYQAARAGVEWGAYQVLRNSSTCATVSQTLPAGTLAGTLSEYSVSVSCTPYAQSDVNQTVNLFQITTTAKQGSPGTAGYVERQLSVTIAQP